MFESFVVVIVIGLVIGLWICIAGLFAVAVGKSAHSVHFTALWAWGCFSLYVIRKLGFTHNTNALWALSHQWDVTPNDATGKAVQLHISGVATSWNVFDPLPAVELVAGNRGRGQIYTDGSPTNNGGFRSSIPSVIAPNFQAHEKRRWCPFIAVFLDFNVICVGFIVPTSQLPILRRLLLLLESVFDYYYGFSEILACVTRWAKALFLVLDTHHNLSAVVALGLVR